MPSQKTAGRLQNPPSVKAGMIKILLKKRILSNLVVAGRLAPCLHVSDVLDGDGVLLCVLLVPIHSRVEVRNRRNLPEMSVTI